MKEKEQGNYQVFLNDGAEDIATYSNLTLQQARTIARNLSNDYLPAYPNARVHIIEEG